MTSRYIVEDVNLSNAWMQAFSQMVEGKKSEITPLLITLTDFEESSEIRNTLDSCLDESQLSQIQTVSETIFPNSLYLLCDKNRHTLYARYKRNLPRIRKIDSSNRKGTYFERMIAFDGETEKINQLEMIIMSISTGNIKRRSKLQICIFDPRVDHTGLPFQGFPCLQHVTFYVSENGGLILNSFYAIQYLYQRAYGNWLGLINLGKFVAEQLNIPFERFNCYIGIEKLDTENISKMEARKLLQKLK